jgi:hypothetical protein
VSGQHHAPAAHYPRERTFGTHWTGGWVGPSAGLDAEARRKILCPCRGSNLSRPIRSQTLHWLSYSGSDDKAQIPLIFINVILHIFQYGKYFTKWLQGKTISSFVQSNCTAVSFETITMFHAVSMRYGKFQTTRWKAFCVLLEHTCLTPAWHFCIVTRHVSHVFTSASSLGSIFCHARKITHDIGMIHCSVSVS